MFIFFKYIICFIICIIDNIPKMIKTAIIPLCTDKVEFEVCFTSSANQCIYCARTKTSTPDSFSGFLLSSKFRIDRANSAGSLNSVKTVSVNGTVRYRVTADYKYRSVEIDGGDFGLVNQIMVSNQTFTVGGPLALFSSYEKSSSGASWSGETRNNGGTFRLYSFKLTGEDGTVKLDLIPVVKEGVAYLYNKISGDLLGKSSGSGTFGKGGVTADALPPPPRSTPYIRPAKTGARTIPTAGTAMPR